MYMTLRDYFIAHAPNEPWPEFEPNIPPRPSIPNPTLVLSQEDYRAWISECLDHSPEICSANLIEFGRSYNAAHTACNEWEIQKKLRRHVQWPAYWADQMLKARTT